MIEFSFSAKDEADTRRLGAALAETLPAGTTTALMGTLGAGKTRLVQAIAEACGVPSEAVVSPTFVLCQEYHGRRTLYHLDAYRLRDEDEFLQLGPEEYFESDGLTLIEWADRVSGCLPPDRLEIHIEVTANDAREFRLVAVGVGLEQVIRELAERL
jgi:tRNA threonylcarbamoyladenosine biosynthesis protein TsaE